MHPQREAAARLQVWGFPLVMAQWLRLNFTQPRAPFEPRPPTSAGAALGRIGHQRELSDPSLRVGVAPNVDTLYSVAWLDLDAGEHVLHTPDVGDRYVSWQIGLADTGSPWAFGQRTHGSRVPPLRLRRGALGRREGDGQLEVTTPHRFLMVCGRILVDPGRADDLARVHALQDQVRLEAPAVRAGCEPEGLRDEDLDAVAREDEVRVPAAFARSVARVVRDLAPESVPASVRRDLATCGMRVDGGFEGAADAVRDGLVDGADRVAARVGSLSRVEHGWALNSRGPDVGGDLELRAAVAMAQIYVNPAEEAVYPVAEVDSHGRALDGARAAYTLTFAADDQPPAGAFWSLTVYHRAGLLVENPLRRYAIGDRTPGLRHEKDGSLVVQVSAQRPAEGPHNWLPAPSGPFRLMLRLYCPTDPDWTPPPVEAGRPRDWTAC